QDLTAGKTPAQLFNSDCAECHHSPSGLARNRDVRVLASFLREHYTTKSDTASALAAYVSGFSGGGAAARNRGTGVAVPANTPSEGRPVDRRRRNDSDATENDVRTNVRAVEDTATGRRRRATNLSGEGEKRRIRSDSDAAAAEDEARTNTKPVEDTT